MKKVIITAPAHPVLSETFTKNGYIVVYEPEISYLQLEQLMSEVEGLVVTTRIKVDRNLIDKAPALQWVGRLGSGLELIDVPYATSKNIKCISTPEGNRNAVAEHTLGLVLNLLHKINKSALEVKAGSWFRNENRGTELTGKTVGIIGYGNTGSSFARLLQPFNVTVLVYDKYKDGFASEYIRECNLEQISKYADIISFHVPLTEETFHMAGESFFTNLKNKPFFISTCRGEVTDTNALINALSENKLSGAALDVLENEHLHSFSATEKEQFKKLLNDPRVIVTPHIAGYSQESFFKMSSFLLQKLGLK
jgi:D-3-phosphoglycerate dehydrogenase / 2-oxoglutarate reductase